MIGPKNYKNISTEVEDINKWFEKINDGSYISRLHAYVGYHLHHELAKEETEIANLYRVDNYRDVYTATKISDKVYVVENPQYNRGIELKTYYFAYYGQQHISKEAYSSFEIAAIAGLLFSFMGKNVMSESILNIIIKTMEDKNKNKK